MNYYEYRIYEVGGEREESVWGLSQPRTLITQNTLVVDDYQMFKETIIELYGKIGFRRTKKMVDGDLYCVIVTKSRDKTDFERSQVHEITCDCCGKKFLYSHKYRPNGLISIKHREISNYTHYSYCSSKCKETHHKKLYEEFIKTHDGLNPNEFIDRNAYYDGCIYIITKKSTGEFYIGQTNSIPVFRWAQHLKTDRFPIANLVDYKFEVLEVVKDLTMIFEIESRYIKEYAEKYPTLTLNKSGVTKKMKEQTNLFEEDN